MSESVIKYEVPCPRPECEGKCRVSAGLPAGVYDCPCKACKISVSWSPYCERFQEPRLTVEEEWEAARSTTP